MVADLREMQENQWVSEIQIDKLEFAEVLEDCTPTEIESILKIVKEVKKSMHSPKGNNDY